MPRNPSRLMRAPPVAPHANGGTYLGGRTASNTLAPVPTTVPVASSVPIAVLPWSPMRLPNNWRPVSSGVPATSSRTRPYVFFRFDVIVPAPRFAQHRAARGNRVGVAEQRPQVGVEQLLERGDQVVDAVQHDARHLDRPRVRLGPVPHGTRPHAPAHRDAAAREPERAVGEGGREPVRREGR